MKTTPLQKFIGGAAFAALIVLGTLAVQSDSTLWSSFLSLSKISPALQGQVTLGECKGMNGVNESCYWRYQYDNTVCSKTKPCSKMVVYFSGGEMSCDDTYTNPNGAQSRIMAAYAKDGYVAVCAGLFLTDANSNAIPFNKESNRVDALIKNIRANSNIKSIWNGQNLLFAGISHGSNAPVDAMARTSLDSNSTWKGSRKTAGCFLDGNYDQPAADAFFVKNASTCVALRTHIMCQRYSGTSGNCPLVTLQNPEAALDTITTVAASEFAIPNWKLVECGSALPACADQGDWLPAPSIKTLCSNLDASSAHTCEFGSLPTQSHIDCMSTPEGIASCKDWFNNLTK